jgi:hypothetical protein
MKIFINIFQKFISKQSVVLLGRWKLHNCPNSINIKIDSSNTDHCGTCTLTNNKIIDDKITIVKAIIINKN